MSGEPTVQEVLSDLARAKATFQLRTIALYLDLPLSASHLPKEVPPCTPRK